MLLTVFAHVDADHRALVVEEEVRQGFGELRLTHAGRAEEQEGTGGPIGVGDTCSGAANRIRDGDDGVGLADDALAEFGLHAEQLLGFAFHHPAGGDSGPGCDHVCDVVGPDLFLEHHVTVGGSSGSGCCLFQFLLERRDTAVAQLGCLAQIAVTLSAFGLSSQSFELFLQHAHRVDGLLFVLPAGAELIELFAVVREFLTQLLEPSLGRVVCFLLECHFFDFESANRAFHLVDLDGTRVDLHTKSRCGFVHEVDGLVRQEPRRDVAVRQRGSRHQRGVGDAHAVVHLVALLEAAQDTDGVLDRGLTDEHLLETTLECCVLLDVLAVLLECGRTDQP